MSIFPSEIKVCLEHFFQQPSGPMCNVCAYATLIMTSTSRCTPQRHKQSYDVRAIVVQSLYLVLRKCQCLIRKINGCVTVRPTSGLEDTTIPNIGLGSCQYSFEFDLLFGGW
jgi:hypothetical protein